MPCASGSKLTPGRAEVSRWCGRTGAIHCTVGALAAKSRACGLPARVMTCGSCGGAARPGPPPAISGPLSCRSTKPSTSSLPKASSGSGLDAYTRYKTCKAKLRKVLERELKDLHKETGKTFMYITHSLEEAMVMSDRIGVMRSGRLVQVGTPEDIYNRPADRFVSEFMGDVNVITVTPNANGSFEGVDVLGHFRASITAP